MTVATKEPRNDELLEQLLQRSATDRRFRERLLNEPTAAIEEAIGVTLPGTMRVRFIVKDPDVDQLVVLPELQAPDVRVSDAELRNIMGGWCVTSCGLSLCIASDGGGGGGDYCPVPPPGGGGGGGFCITSCGLSLSI